MNSRRVHELMKARFPENDLSTLAWHNLLERDGSLRRATLSALIEEFTSAESLLVEVNRKLGDFLPRDGVIPFVEQHIGETVIRIADRNFLGCILIASNGVASGWSTAGNY